MTKSVHVAVAVIRDDQGKILIARRPEEKHMGGFWEFPGGKVEEGESVQQALTREILEEVNLHVDELLPLIQIPWQYPGKQVLLDVFECKVQRGEARGSEGQEIRWVPSQELGQYTFPPANKGILNAIRLPDKLLITGEAESEQEFFSKLDRAIARGLHLVQLRDLRFCTNALPAFLDKLYERYSTINPELTFLINASPEEASACAVSSLHLKSKYLKETELNSRLEEFMLVSASVHNEEELELAVQLNLDFILVSPVQFTSSHPESTPMGWEALRALVNKAPMPVYALGGLGEEDIEQAKAAAAQGIAAISAFWL